MYAEAMWTEPTAVKRVWPNDWPNEVLSEHLADAFRWCIYCGPDCRAGGAGRAGRATRRSGVLAGARWAVGR